MHFCLWQAVKSSVAVSLLIHLFLIGNEGFIQPMGVTAQRRILNRATFRLKASACMVCYCANWSLTAA